MSGITHTTKGIVIRTVPYGETSVIATVFTELFGMQAYLINGIRTTSKKGSTKASFFQPAAMLELVVYHNEFRNLNRIKEYKWDSIYRHIFSDVMKHGVAVYMIEVLHKSVKATDGNEDLYAFVADCLLHLDAADDATMANFPMFFAIHLSAILGFSPGFIAPEVLASPELIFDLQEGVFTDHIPVHNFYCSQAVALIIAEVLQTRLPQDLPLIKTNAELRNKVLDALETFYILHITDFGKLRTLPVLREVMR